MTDFITRNLQDQSGNFGQETKISPVGGSQSFVDPATGQPINRGIDAGSFQLANSPLDNSFQLDPQQHAVAVGMFQKIGVPNNLSNLFGSIAAVTAKSYGLSPNDLYKNGVMSQALLDNINYFRDAGNQIGYNKNNGVAPYQNNFLLGSKLSYQTQ